MIPIRNSAPPCRAPVGTLLLLLANALVFLWCALLPQGRS